MAIYVQAQTANIFTRLFTLYNMTFAVKIILQTPRSWAADDQTKKFALGNVAVFA